CLGYGREPGAARYARTRSGPSTPRDGQGGVRGLLRLDDVVACFADTRRIPLAVPASASMDSLPRGFVLLALPDSPADRGLAAGGGRRGRGPLVAQARLYHDRHVGDLPAHLRPLRPLDLYRTDPQRAATRSGHPLRPIEGTPPHPQHQTPSVLRDLCVDLSGVSYTKSAKIAKRGSVLLSRLRYVRLRYHSP